MAKTADGSVETCRKAPLSQLFYRLINLIFFRVRLILNPENINPGGKNRSPDREGFKNRLFYSKLKEMKLNYP